MESSVIPRTAVKRIKELVDIFGGTWPNKEYFENLVEQEIITVIGGWNARGSIPNRIEEYFQINNSYHGSHRVLAGKLAAQRETITRIFNRLNILPHKCECGGRIYFKPGVNDGFCPKKKIHVEKSKLIVLNNYNRRREWKRG